MNNLFTALLDRLQLRQWLIAAVLVGCLPPSQLLAGELVEGTKVPVSAQVELHRLLAGNSSAQQLLTLAGRLYTTGRLSELGSGGLPWSTWTAPGWRWESGLADGTRIVLATDGIVLVAIREARTIEFSVLDLSACSVHEVSAGVSGSILGPGISAQHLIAASPRDLALKAPQLFPIYYYFAGPTADIVGSRVLPYPAVPRF